MHAITCTLTTFEQKQDKICYFAIFDDAKKDGETFAYKLDLYPLIRKITNKRIDLDLIQKIDNAIIGKRFNLVSYETILGVKEFLKQVI